jgi:hypothetical protein
MFFPGRAYTVLPRATLATSLVCGSLLVVLLVAQVQLSVSNQVTVLTATHGKWFDYVVIIMLENHSINDTYYNGMGTNPCIGNCTYFTSLANTYGLAEGYTIDSIQSGSVGDYIAITSGIGTAPNSCNSGPNPPNTNGCPLFQGLN